MAAASPEQRRIFAQHYATCGNATAAARAAGVPNASAHSMGYKWLRNPAVMAMVREEINSNLRSLAPLAMSTLRALLLDSGTPPSVKLGAARDALDRAGLVPPRRADSEPDVYDKDPAEMTRAELEFLAVRQQFQPFGRDPGSGDPMPTASDPDAHEKIS